jgi:hypothetical protein
VFKLLKDNWKTEKGDDRMIMNRFSWSGHKNDTAEHSSLDTATWATKFQN